jgi:hypothetical protein
MATRYPHPVGQTPSPSTTTRAPELPANDGIKVGATDLKTVITMVAITAAVIVLAPVVIAGAVVVFGFGSLFA